MSALVSLFVTGESTSITYHNCLCSLKSEAEVAKLRLYISYATVWETLELCINLVCDDRPSHCRTLVPVLLDFRRFKK